MITHPRLAVHFVTGECDTQLTPLLGYLQTISAVQIDWSAELPAELNSHVVVVRRPAHLSPTDQTRLRRFVEAGGGCLGLIDPSADPLPELFGVQSGETGPAMELRVLFTDPAHPLATRLPDSFYINNRYHALKIESDRVETLLYVDWQYQHSPVVVNRPVGTGQVASTTLRAYSDPAYQQLFYRLLRQLAGQPNSGQTLGVGLVGYSPAVGQLHGQGIEATAGLALRAACDLNPQRLAEARRDFPDLHIFQSTGALAADPDVEVVIIATPPNSHARLALPLLEAGKHVICEKPLALNPAETEAMIGLADKMGRHLGCHQNRRWDVDYLAIKQALAEGLIGDLFYMETFVGGFNHPCGYWHSHAPISGGTTYDWGAHYLDWVLSLMPDAPTAVIGTRQKRVWHDVTNADQERVQLRFAGGQEAELIHSDIAAIPKPKWYLLGTEGAIVGQWRQVTVHQVDPLHYFQQRDIPPTEMPPDLIVQRRHSAGRLVEQRLTLPPREPFPFHRNLADHLLTGEPVAVPVPESARVVEVLAAAARSAESGGRVERLGGMAE